MSPVVQLLSTYHAVHPFRLYFHNWNAKRPCGKPWLTQIKQNLFLSSTEGVILSEAQLEVPLTAKPTSCHACFFFCVHIGMDSFRALKTFSLMISQVSWVLLFFRTLSHSVQLTSFTNKVKSMIFALLHAFLTSLGILNFSAVW